MSILNIILRSTTRAEIFVDTFACDIDLGVGKHVNKIFALPHLGGLIGGCGLAHTIFTLGAIGTQSPSLEALCDGVPGAIAWANAERRKVPGGASPALDEQEAHTSIAVVAWDGTQVICKLWNAYDSRDPAHAVIDLHRTRSRTYFAPDITMDALPTNDAGYTALARRQVAKARERYGPNAPIGGRLIGATLERGRISMRTVGDLEAEEFIATPARTAGAAVVVA